MSLRLLPVAAATLAVLSAFAAGAVGPDAEPEPAGPAELSDQPTLHGKLALSLADAVKMGLENNLDVEVDRHEPLIAEQDVRVAWGSYDPELFSEFGYNSTDQPNANILLGTSINTIRSTDGEGGLRGVLPFTSTIYEASFAGSRQTTNSAIQLLSPELRSEWNLSVTQPLLRDLVWNEPWTQVKTTQILEDVAGDNFRASVMDVVRNIEEAYWALVAAEEQERVDEKSLETAQALLDQTETQYEVGVVSRVEVTEAEAGVAQREFNLIRSSNAHRNTQDRLIDLVLGRGLRAESTMEIVPTDRPEEYVTYDIDVPQAVERAFQYRPELEAARREIERQEVQLHFAKSQRLPRLDAIVGYGQRGLGGDQSPDAIDFGTGMPLPPGTIASRNFGDTFDNYDDADIFTARALFSIPIPNRAARGGVSRTELELRRAKTRKLRLEQSIILEVRERARNLAAAQEGIEAAERARVAAEEQLRAERIRLEYGESTPFDVLLREEDLVLAESRKIGALQVYRTSATDLDRAQGTILRNRNIRIDQVDSLRLRIR